MKYLITISTFALLLGCKQSIVGSYSNCGKESYGCSFLKLKHDKSFKYQVPNHDHMGVTETIGTYEVREDTIILNNNLNWHTITYPDNEVNIDSCQVIQLVQSYGGLKENVCGSGKLITNNKIEFQADSLGYFRIKKHSFDSVRVEYVGCHINWIDFSNKESNQDTLKIQCNLENIGHTELIDFKFLKKKDSLLCLKFPYKPWHLKKGNK